MNDDSLRKRVLIMITAFGFAIIIGSLLIYINGDSPVESYLIMLEGAFGSVRAIANTLSIATPLILTALSVAIAFRAGAINIGSEGQMAMGAITAALLGIYVNGFPPFLHVLLAVIGAFLAGAVWAFIPGLLKSHFKVNEIVTTLMANYIAILFTDYLVTYPFRKPHAPMGISLDILPTARLNSFIPLTRFGWGFIIAVLAAVSIWWLYQKTVFGRELTVVGSNLRFAKYIGIKTKPCFLWAMCLSGGLAGLAGAVVVLGIQFRFVQGITAGMGFDGIPISLIARNRPAEILIIAIIFGALRVGGLKMEGLAGIPFELTRIIESITVLLLAGHWSFKFLAKAKRRTKNKVKSSEVEVDGNV